MKQIFFSIMIILVQIQSSMAMDNNKKQDLKIKSILFGITVCGIRDANYSESKTSQLELENFIRYFGEDFLQTSTKEEQDYVQEISSVASATCGWMNKGYQH